MYLRHIICNIVCKSYAFLRQISSKISSKSQVNLRQISSKSQETLGRFSGISQENIRQISGDLQTNLLKSHANLVQILCKTHANIVQISCNYLENLLKYQTLQILFLTHLCMNLVLVIDKALPFYPRSLGWIINLACADYLRSLGWGHTTFGAAGLRHRDTALLLLRQVEFTSTVPWIDIMSITGHLWTPWQLFIPRHLCMPEHLSTPGQCPYSLIWSCKHLSITLPWLLSIMGSDVLKLSNFGYKHTTRPWHWGLL